MTYKILCKYLLIVLFDLKHKLYMSEHISLSIKIKKN
jgi:hypothetical protein